ncbi:hypothetical protein QC760_001021 [Botrytis cinerea]|uniref:Uncharacterized protein n=1 Tax=Botryotinia fuckeliana (strain T4) TaxID=999810 RepID=G2YG02_BOTF4|nr:hypothetical protein BofuT4_uP087630.1 [Botrytis cinerea T4]
MSTQGVKKTVGFATEENTTYEAPKHKNPLDDERAKEGKKRTASSPDRKEKTKSQRPILPLKGAKK